MANPTSTAASPTKLCRIATSSGIDVIWTREARIAPTSEAAIAPTGSFKDQFLADVRAGKAFFYNTVLLALAVGNLLGLGICFLQDKFKIIELNPRDYYMSFVPISWHWEIVVLLNVITLGLVTLILLLPTMAISRITPIKAIRFD